MPQSNAGMKAFVATAVLERAIRVKFSSGEVVAAGSGEEGIGTTYASVAAGNPVDVLLDDKSVEVTASGTIAQGGNCYGAALGDVSATIAGRRIGIALEAATDTQLFEMMVAGVNS